jgi:hypothetical protein
MELIMSKLMNQRDGVFAAVTTVLTEAGKEIQSNKVELTKDETKTVVLMVAEGIHAELIEMKAESRAKYNTVDLLRTKYVPGLVNDFFRKDKRVNGGDKYETKNPGSRASDPVVKELNKLVELHAGNDEVIAAIQAEIATRQAAKNETKKIVINESLVPDSLKQFIK